VLYQSLPRTISCSSLTLYCNPPQRVFAVLSISTLNDIHMNTYVYSMTPVTAQDYNPVYTRVCIHTVFSCQVCFKESRRLAFYRDDGTAWSLMVHQLSWTKVATSTTSFELPSKSTSGQSTYQVWDKWPTWQAADQSATQTLNCGNTSRFAKNSTCLKLN